MSLTIDVNFSNNRSLTFQQKPEVFFQLFLHYYKHQKKKKCYPQRNHLFTNRNKLKKHKHKATIEEDFPIHST